MKMGIQYFFVTFNYWIPDQAGNDSKICFLKEVPPIPICENLLDNSGFACAPPAVGKARLWRLA